MRLLTRNREIDYVDVFKSRQDQIRLMRVDRGMTIGAFEYYRSKSVDFVIDFGTTYDPRNAGRKDKIATLPFILFKRQCELIEFFEWCRINESEGVVEKSRDQGATWVAVAYAVWLWIYVPGATIGFGSRKEQLIDRLGDSDTIFEKIRMFIRYLPEEFVPRGYVEKVHATYMRIINPVTGNSITGEAGDNIGRGGRKLIYFVDEAAFLDRPEKIEASLSENTRVKIYISSVNGLGNIFHRKRHCGFDWQSKSDEFTGLPAVFVMDWRDNPLKTQEWYDQTRDKFFSQGLEHIFESEVNRNYGASVERTLIKREWIECAYDLHEKLNIDVESVVDYAGLDIADSGGDSNVYSQRTGIHLHTLDEWYKSDSIGLTTLRALDIAKRSGKKV